MYKGSKDCLNRAFLLSVTTKKKTDPDALILLHALKSHFDVRWWRAFECLLALFLTVSVRTLLGNAQGCSSSTLSRLLNLAPWKDQELYKALNTWQTTHLRKFHAHRRGRKPTVRVRLDLTSLEKTGKKLPFVRVYNKVFGIHLVVLHISVGDLSFPLGVRVYALENKETPIALALDLLEKFPAWTWPEFRVCLLADSGFFSVDFLEQVRVLGYNHVSLGAKSNLTLRGGAKLSSARRGSKVWLESLACTPLYVAWIDLPRKDGLKRFFVLSTMKGSVRTLLGRHAKRWLIESYFKSAQYDFGLNETRLRTEDGIRRWIFVSFLAYSLSSLERALEGRKSQTQNPERWTLTLARAAQTVLETLLLEWRERVRIPALLAELYALGVPLCILPHRVFVGSVHICKS